MSRFDPTQLEPKDGDFVRYIEQLNRGEIDHATLPSAHADLAPGSDLTVNAPVIAHTGEQQVTSIRQQDRSPRTKRPLIKTLTPFVILLGFGCFAAGGFINDERMVFGGMGIFVLTMFANAIFGRKRK